MNSIEQASLKYLALVIAAERRHRAAHPHQDPSLMATRFWDARSLAKQAGLDDADLREVVRHLSEKDLLHWHDKSGRSPTVRLTEEGFSQPVPEVPTAIRRRHHHHATMPGDNRAPSTKEVVCGIASGLGFIACAGGATLVFLSRDSLAQGIEGSEGSGSAIIGVAGLILGGLLLGATLRRTGRLFAKLLHRRRGRAMSAPSPV